MPAELGDLRREVHRRLLERSDQTVIDAQLTAAVAIELAPLLDRNSLDRLVSEVLSDIKGLGPLDELLADETLTDLMVVGDRGVWVERSGRVEQTALKLSRSDVEHLIERVVSPLGLRVDRSSPMVDARLPDGSRVNAVVPPLAVDGPCLTIRRFAARGIELTDIASAPVAELLCDAVQSHQNIVISGGTGAGKTTLLNSLAGYIGSRERVITVEDAAELRLPMKHVVRLEGRPANSEGAGRITLRDLVRNALRMRPDRIIVGEVRGPEALDMLQAMNTGHEGSMSTCHANSPADAVRRLETMVLMSELGLPLAAVREQIASAVDLIVQIARTKDGSRQVVDVSELDISGGEVNVRRLASQHGVLAQAVRPLRRSAS